MYHLLTDSHLGHQALLKYKTRPANFSDLILSELENTEGEVLIHLGDVCIGHDADWHSALLKAAKGFKHKILILGNHDHKSMSWYYGMGWNAVMRSMTLDVYGKRLILSHAPLKIRNFGRDDYAFDYNIHGHLHGDAFLRARGVSKSEHRIEEDSVSDYDVKYHIDVAPELWGFKPVNLQKILSNQDYEEKY